MKTYQNKNYVKLNEDVGFIVITLLYERTLKQSLVDNKTDEKEELELKKICNKYLDERNELMKNTQFKVEDNFGDVIGKGKNSQDQLFKPKIFQAK